MLHTDNWPSVMEFLQTVAGPSEIEFTRYS